MINVNHYDDPESILNTEGAYPVPTDEKTPDDPAVREDYERRRSERREQLRAEMRKDVAELREKFFHKTDPHDHQPIPGWVTATLIIGTLGAVFALGAMFAK